MSAPIQISPRPAWQRRAGVLGRELSVVAAMALSAACIGFGVNTFRSNPLPLAYEPKAVRVQNAASRLARDTGPASPAPEVSQIDLPAFRDVVEHRVPGIILDARPAGFYRIGHVPGAISLSREAFEADYTRQRKLLEASKAAPIVVYCSDSGCEDSGIVASGLAKLAYSRVYVFKGGWEDWTAAQLPEEKAP